ncbi:MAG: hypothetical protein K2X72_05410 [Reyranella sp.]|nr:hypothetical protein [Reyranella sp.]
MFNVRPNLRVPGFNVRQPEDEVPGFRLNADGTIGEAPMAAAKPSDNPFDILQPQSPAAWPPPYLAFDKGADGRSPFPSAAAGERRTDGPQGGNLVFDAATPRTMIPIRCESTVGEFGCTTPGGTSFGPLPAPKGFPATIGPESGSHHQYRYESAPFYNPKEVMRQAIERPTFGPSDRVSPATRQGTANEATPQPYHSIAEAVKAATGMHGFPVGPVKSHVTEDQHGNTVVVNVTEPGHVLFPGYVVHSIVKSDDGSYRLVTEGEGLGLLQSKHAPEKLRDIINRQTWEGYQKEIVDRAKPR